MFDIFNRGFNVFDDDDVVNFSHELALALSEKQNVLFCFSEFVKLGSGGTRRFNCNCRDDVDLVFSVNENGFSKDSLIVWAKREERTVPEYIVDIGIESDFSFVDRNEVYCDFVSTLISISILHEMQHVQQYDVARGVVLNSEGLDDVVLHSLVMSCDNSDFYHDNYNLMLHEIDAEKNGVLDAYNKLCVMYGKSRAKQLVTEALRYSDEQNIGPVNYGGCKGGFTETWFEKCIDKAYANALKSKRDASCLYDVFTDDFAANYFALNDDDKKDFLNLSSGAEQDAYLAMISMMYSEKSRDYFDDSVIVFPEDIPRPLGGRLNRSIAVYNDVGGRDTSYIGNNFLDDNDIVFDDEYD